MNFTDIARIEWEYLVHRRELPLLASLTLHGYDFFRKATGLPLDIQYSLHTYRLGVYYSHETLAKLRAVLMNGGPTLFWKFRERLLKSITTFDRISSNIESINTRSLSRRRLTLLLDTFEKQATESHNFLVPVAVSEQALRNRILERLPSATEKTRFGWLSLLAYPTRVNSHVHEQQSFFNLVYAYTRDRPTFQRQLQTHLRRFGWIGARNYVFGAAWTEETMVQRIKEFLAQRKRPSYEQDILKRIRPVQRRAARKLLDTLKIQRRDPLHEWIRLAQEFVFLRTWRTEIIYRSGFRTREIFFEIARRVGFPSQDVGWLTIDEIRDMLRRSRQKVSRKEINNRKKFVALIRIGRKNQLFSGAERAKQFSRLLGARATTRQTLEGQTAYPGRVRGIVRVVFESADLRKVKRNDILVAVMTFPHFVPAMEKAAAFVTDEGGILCHAAIVAREMKKPCVIGTKVATKVFKDGDRVEVDATNGVVRKV